MAFYGRVVENNEVERTPQESSSQSHYSLDLSQEYETTKHINRVFLLRFQCLRISYEAEEIVSHVEYVKRKERAWVCYFMNMFWSNLKNKSAYHSLDRRRAWKEFRSPVSAGALDGIIAEGREAVLPVFMRTSVESLPRTSARLIPVMCS